MKILITAFDAFGNHTENSSLEVLKALPDSIGGFQLIKAELPTAIVKAQILLNQLLLEHKPKYCVSLGQAQSRKEITFERVALNIMDFEIPDNEDYQPRDVPIVPDGPVAYFLTLPNKEMIKKLRETKIPASISNSAGTYVCNFVSYWIAHHIAINDLSCVSGFIHLPLMTHQSDTLYSLPLETMVEGVKLSLEILIENR